MPVRINLKELFAADVQTIFTDKINYNFNKMLELGIGEIGERGITGPGGSAGPGGIPGPTGQRGNKWFVGAGDPNGQSFTGLIDGDFYLEVHHPKRLADNGSDTPSNAVALCPNCHREMHYGENRNEILNQLYSKIERLVRE